MIIIWTHKIEDSHRHSPQAIKVVWLLRPVFESLWGCVAWVHRLRLGYFLNHIYIGRLNLKNNLWWSVLHFLTQQTGLGRHNSNSKGTEFATSHEHQSKKQVFTKSDFSLRTEYLHFRIVCLEPLKNFWLSIHEKLLIIELLENNGAFAFFDI